jgi:hypothetical protein
LEAQLRAMESMLFLSEKREKAHSTGFSGGTCQALTESLRT